MSKAYHEGYHYSVVAEDEEDNCWFAVVRDEISGYEQECSHSHRTEAAAYQCGDRTVRRWIHQLRYGMRNAPSIAEASR